MDSYKLLTSDDPKKLEELVNAWLSYGWKLAGGVSCSLSESDDFRYLLFAQAMTIDTGEMPERK